MKEYRISFAEREMPVLFPAAGEESDAPHLCVWLESEQRFWRDLVNTHGAVLFRDFDLRGSQDLELLSARLFGNLCDYAGGFSPRTKLTSAVYMSTEYPKEFPISLHNELSYTYRWPSWLIFMCDIAPESGGQTPL